MSKPSNGTTPIRGVELPAHGESYADDAPRGSTTGKPAPPAEPDAGDVAHEASKVGAAIGTIYQSKLARWVAGLLAAAGVAVGTWYVRGEVGKAEDRAALEQRTTADDVRAIADRRIAIHAGSAEPHQTLARAIDKLTTAHEGHTTAITTLTAELAARRALDEAFRQMIKEELDQLGTEIRRSRRRGDR